MANLLGNMPIQIDTDLANFRTAYAATGLAAGDNVSGIRPFKIVLQAITTTTAGNVTITNPNDSTNLFPPMAVPASATTGTILFYDAPAALLTWPNFAVTGVTATGTRLWIWFRN